MKPLNPFKNRINTSVLLCTLITLFTSVQVNAQWTEEQKILATFDGAANDVFGYSVSISGTTAIVGANGDDDFGSASGSAYIFEKSGGSWTQTAKLTASDGAVNDLFGFSVSVSGTSAIVGAYGDDSRKGSAYIFEKPGTGWADMTQTAKLSASDGAANDVFGYSVSISGTTAIVGAYLDDDIGFASGSAYIFEKSGGSWTQTAKLTASDGAAGDNFAISVSVSGTSAIVGAWFDDDNGISSGSAYIFEKPGTGWANMTQNAKLTASDGATGDRFGFSVSFSGTSAIAGAFYDDSEKGSAYIFEKPGTGWADMTQNAKLTASDGAAFDHFGFSVSVSGTTAIVGARLDDDNGNNSGSAYIFEKPGTGWADMTQTAKLTASDGAADDLFGFSVSVSGTSALVGAIQDDDNGSNSGSAYLFSVPPPNSIMLSSASGTDAQTVCVNSAITDITYTTTGATGATFTNLPLGVTGTWLADVVTLTGTPTQSGIFNYTVTLIGGDGTGSASGTITVFTIPCSTFPWDGN